MRQQHPQSGSWSDGLARRVAPRAAGLLGLGVAGHLISWVVASRDQSGGANVGVGLLLLGALALTAGAWGARDGLRAARVEESLVPGLVCWAVVALVVGAGLPLLGAAVGALAGGGFSGAVLLRDLLLGAPFLLLLVGVPAHGALAGCYAAVRSRAGRAA
ncbi:hypothetical protein CLV92_105197 [Kineococcus xinjiangensis]|uniref:Uncharacterized protein n=1 Tax=Kineococcus xinjiangensis TaxID=512762 RepID=A0A2S6IPJ5_9ACTN|nr:hypothetical protein [Kineococcus xinjiangensis]PPK96095.1 hypothetical protein CLV92_105197 [Kineococcus xinjiangensis]